MTKSYNKLKSIKNFNVYLTFEISTMIPVYSTLLGKNLLLRVCISNRKIKKKLITEKRVLK